MPGRSWPSTAGTPRQVITLQVVLQTRLLAPLDPGSVIDNRNASLIVVGGGVISVAETTARKAIAVITGGGVEGITFRGGHGTSAVLTGGGTAAVVGRKGALSLTGLTGGGVVTLALRKGTPVTLMLTGGGVYTIKSAKESFTVTGETGGGIITVDHTVSTGPDNRNANLILTGGGVVTITFETVGGTFGLLIADDMMQDGRGWDRSYDYTLADDAEAVLELVACSR